MIEISDELKDQLERIFAAIVIDDPSQVAFCGRLMPTVMPQATPVDTELPPAVNQLANMIYANAYAVPFSGHIQTGQEQVGSEDLSTAYIQANQGRARWEDGWIVTGLRNDGAVHAKRHERQDLFRPGQFASMDGQFPPTVGGAIRVHYPIGSITVQRGWYHAFGEERAVDPGDAPPVRFYFNIQPTGAAQLLAQLTGMLNRYQVPFQFKIPVSTGGFARVDAAVLYVSRRFLPIVLMAVPAIVADLKDHMEADIPLFSLRLADGIGFAEDLGDPTISFGQVRCRQIAAACLLAAKEQRFDPTGRLEKLETLLNLSGSSLAFPHTRSANLRAIILPDGSTHRILGYSA